MKLSMTEPDYANPEFHGSTFFIVWDRKTVPQEDYDEFVKAIDGLARAHGLGGIEKIASKRVGTYNGRFSSKGTETGRLQSDVPNEANTPKPANTPSLVAAIDESMKAEQSSSASERVKAFTDDLKRILDRAKKP